MEHTIFRRILLVDDDEDDYLLTRAMLNATRNVRVDLEWAATYEAGREMIAADNYAAVLVDYNLGARTGVELIREAMARGYPAPLILFTAQGSEEVDMEAMQAGATLYLTKGEASPLLLERVIRYAIERKQVEQALHFQNQVLAHVSDAAVAIDNDYCIIYWNSAAERMYGLPASQAVGRKLSEAYEYRWLRPEDEAAASQALSTRGAWHGENIHINHDGRQMVVESSVSVLKDSRGNQIGLLAIIREITGRKAAEQALLDSERRYRSLFEAMSEGFALGEVICDPAGEPVSFRFLDVNPGFERHTGLKASEVIGRPFHEVLPGLEPYWIETFGRVALTGHPIQFENFNQDLDSWFETYTFSPEPGRFGLLILDVSARLEGEAARRAAEAALLTYSEQLQHSNKALEEFTSIVSHDLQEPLRKVQGFGDLLKNHFAAQLNQQGQDYINRMQQAAGRMQEMIDGLLKYSRVSTQARPFEPVDLQQITTAVLSDLEMRITQTGAQVEVGELPTLSADPLQMRQLVQNLVGNALKFHRPGVPPRVTISTRPQEDGMVEIRVADNGIGFDARDQARIFRPFYRLPEVAGYEGHGVGLAICYKIVERHHGQITVESEPGQGTTFIISLPRNL